MFPFRREWRPCQKRSRFCSKLAEDAEKHPWQFAVDLQSLLKSDCTENGVRWLISKGYLEHAIETTKAKARQRTFSRAKNLHLQPTSCYLLTAQGVAVARQLREGLLVSANGADKIAGKPYWSAETRELRLNGVLLKIFKRPAANQERILTAFEEEDLASADLQSAIAAPRTEVSGTA
jgi:hypothetical protein